MDEGILFWFFGGENLQSLVSILPGREETHNFWVFHSSLCGVSYAVDMEPVRRQIFNYDQDIRQEEAYALAMDMVQQGTLHEPDHHRWLSRHQRLALDDYQAIRDAGVPDMTFDVRPRNPR